MRRKIAKAIFFAFNGGNFGDGKKPKTAHAPQKERRWFSLERKRKMQQAKTNPLLVPYDKLWQCLIGKVRRGVFFPDRAITRQ